MAKPSNTQSFSRLPTTDPVQNDIYNKLAAVLAQVQTLQTQNVNLTARIVALEKKP